MMVIDKNHKFYKLFEFSSTPEIDFLKYYLYFNNVSFDSINKFIFLYKTNKIDEIDLKFLPSFDFQISILNLVYLLEKIGLEDDDTFSNYKSLNRRESFSFLKKLHELSLLFEKNPLFLKHLSMFFKNLIMYGIIYSNCNTWTTLSEDFFNSKKFCLNWKIIRLNESFFNLNVKFTKILYKFFETYLFFHKTHETTTELIMDFFKEKKNDILDSETKEDYNLSIIKNLVILEYLPRLSEIKILYLTKEKKFISFDLEYIKWVNILNDLKIEQGAYLIINKFKYDRISLLYEGASVFFEPQETIFNKNSKNIVSEIIKNKNFNKNLWIEKKFEVKKELLGDNELNKEIFSKEIKIFPNFLDSINYLQKTPFTLDKENLEYINSLYKNLTDPNFETSNAFFKLEKFDLILKLNENEKIFKTYNFAEPLKESIISTEIKNKDKMSQFIFDITTLQQLNLLKNKISMGSYFYYSYLIDRRCRIYPSATLINYQHSKITRALVQPSQNENQIVKIFQKFILNNEFLLKYKIFNFQHLNYLILNKLINYIRIKYNDLDFECFIKNITIVDKNFVFKFTKEILILEQFCDIFFKFGSLTTSIDFNTTIENGLNLAIKINQTLKDDYLNFTSFYVKKDKKFIEYLILFKNYKKFWNSNDFWLSGCWYNDASANVIQLLMFKLFSFNPRLMKIANIFNNDTEHKNIYEYVATEIKKEIKFEAASADIVKQIIMPGAYGQSVLKFIKTADSLLLKNENWKNLENNDENLIFEDENWKNFSINERRKKKNQQLASIEKFVWKVFENENFPIKDYLSLCKNLPKLNKKYRWLNYKGMPIIIEKHEINDYLKTNPQKQKIFILLKKINFIIEKEENFKYFVENVFLKISNQSNESDIKNKKKLLFRNFLLKIDIERIYLDYVGAKDLAIVHENSKLIEKIQKSLQIQQKKLKIAEEKTKESSKRKNLTFYFNGINLNKTGGESEFIKQSIKKRYQLPTQQKDIKKLTLGLSPSSNHADDASIAINCVETAKKYEILLTLIHDSIGTHIGCSFVSKMIFKLENIKFIEYLIENDTYPFDQLNSSFLDNETNLIKNKKKLQILENLRIDFITKRNKNRIIFKENFEIIKKEIFESRKFFN